MIENDSVELPEIGVAVCSASKYVKPLIIFDDDDDDDDNDDGNDVDDNCNALNILSFPFCFNTSVSGFILINIGLVINSQHYSRWKKQKYYH